VLFENAHAFTESAGVIFAFAHSQAGQLFIFQTFKTKTALSGSGFLVELSNFMFWGLQFTDCAAGSLLLG